MYIISSNSWQKKKTFVNELTKPNMISFSFPEIVLEADAVRLFPTTSPHSFTTHASPSASASIAPAESHSTLPGLTRSSGSSYSGKVGLDTLSAASQEGSTSLEIEDTVAPDSEEKQPHPTNLYSGISLVTTESLEESTASRLLLDTTTEKSQTSAYRVFIDTATTGYEEASGHELGTVVAVLGEDVKISAVIEKVINASKINEEEDKINITFQEEVTVYPIMEEELKISPTLEQMAEVLSSLEEEGNVSPTLKEEASAAPTVTTREQDKVFTTPAVKDEDFSSLEEETHVSTSGEEGDVAPVLEEEAVTPTVFFDREKEVNITPMVEEIFPNLKTETEVVLTVEHEEDYKVFPTHEEAEVVSSLEDQVSITPAPKDGATFVPTVASEREFNIDPTLEILTPFPEEKANVAPTLKEEAMVVLTVAWEDKGNITTNHNVPTLEKEAVVEPTAAQEEKSSIAPIDEEGNFAPTLEEEANVAPSFEEAASVTPSSEEEVNVAPTFEEESSVAPTFEQESSVAPTFEEANIAPNLEEETMVNNTLTNSEEAPISPNLEEGSTIPPHNSQTRNWALSTTTTGPPESLNKLDNSRKTSTVTSQTTPDSLWRTKATAATMKATTTTITTTTHWSKRAWSPTTSATKVSHKTAEPHKVTAFIPPVDQYVVDVDFSLTHAPNLLILPNERAAVGGTGTTTGNVKATLISLTLLLLLLDAVMY